MFRHKFLFARLTMAGLLSVSLMPVKAARAEETRESESETRSGESEARTREETGDSAQTSNGTGGASPMAAAPVVPPSPGRATLTGDWGGLRSHLSKSGVNFRADYVSESFAMVDGGLRRGNGYAQQIRAGVDVDLAKTMGWKGAIFHFTLNDRAGVGASSQIAGNRLPIQEVAGGNYAKLTEFTIEQKLLGDRLDLRLGYYAMGNDLGGMALGCNLVNAAFCAHPLSMSGDTGWYNYPNARWGLTIRYRLLKELTVRTGINQVNPDLSLRRNGFKPFAGGSTGFLVPLEFEYDPGSTPTSHMLPGHYKLGAYYDSTTVTRQGGGGMVTGRYGLYLLADQMIWRGTHGRGLSIFGQVTANPRNTAPLTRWYAAGFVKTGTFPGRDADTISFGVIQAKVNPNVYALHTEALEQAGSFTALPTGETAVELSYGIQVKRWLNIRPDVQYIIDPGAFSFRNTRNVVALGGQIKAQF